MEPSELFIASHRVAHDMHTNAHADAHAHAHVHACALVMKLPREGEYHIREILRLVLFEVCQLCSLSKTLARERCMQFVLLWVIVRCCRSAAALYTRCVLVGVVVCARV